MERVCVIGPMYLSLLRSLTQTSPPVFVTIGTQDVCVCMRKGERERDTENLGYVFLTHLCSTLSVLTCPSLLSLAFHCDSFPDNILEGYHCLKAVSHMAKAIKKF